MFMAGATIMRALSEFVGLISLARITLARRLSEKPPEILANMFAVNGATSMDDMDGDVGKIYKRGYDK